MAMPMESPISFTNVGRIKWWQRGIFASQTGYVLLALAVLLVIMHFASPYFFTQGNMQNVAKNFSFIAVATLGVTFVIITGGIDLSVGSMMCFSAMITSMVMTELSAPGSPLVHMAADGKTVLANVPGLILLVSVLAGLGVALIAGLINGFCIAVLGLSPFVTTLGMLSIVRGLGYVVSNGRGSFPGGPDADYFYAATSGAELTSATLDGKPVGVSAGKERGHPVFIVDVELPRGKPRTVVLNIDEPHRAGEPIVFRQPLVRDLALDVRDTPC